MNQLWQKIKGNKFILGFLIFDLLAILLLVALSIVNSFRTATVSIQVVPSDSKITINGKTYENNNTYNILPSKNAKIEISHEDLETISYTQDLDNNTTTNISRYLTGKDQDFSYYEYKDHEEDSERLINLASSFPNNKKLQKFIKKVKILQDLPLFYEDYLDNYSIYIGVTISRYTKTKECERKICLLLDDKGENSLESTKFILEKYGYNPSDYQLSYISTALSPKAVINE